MHVIVSKDIDALHSPTLQLQHVGKTMKRIIPILVLISVAGIGTGITLFVNEAAKRAGHAQFDIVANEAANRIERSINQSILLLNSTAAHMKTSLKALERGEFSTFVDAIDLPEQYPGLQGIGMALVVNPDQEALASEYVSKNYGKERPVWPPSSQKMRTAIILIEPQDQRNRAVLGFDMYSEAVRRTAMDNALTSGRASATAPVDLIQEITADKQKGLLIYVPVQVQSLSGAVTGFVYAPLRAKHFHDAALKNTNLPTEYQTVDPQASNTILTQSPGFEERNNTTAFKSVRQIKVAGRIWQVNFAATDTFSGENWQLGTLLLGVVSFLLAAALATSTHSQIQSLENAERLAELSQRSLEDKDMLLQEMKHRIKNSITRVLAIARQTASSSGDMESFKESFFARLQSMAASQELLTRSHYEKASLRDLLDRELSQVLGESWDKGRMSGPDVSLNERATQAMGLTFHELATNALKYGDPDAIKEGFAVRWKLEGKSLLIEWFEPEGKENLLATPGFGTRLIAMNVERELGGSIERHTDCEGFKIRMSLPVKALA